MQLLANFPPTHIVACEYDALLDCAVDMNGRLQAAGRNVRLFAVSGCVHFVMCVRSAVLELSSKYVNVVLLCCAGVDSSLTVVEHTPHGFLALFKSGLFPEVVIRCISCCIWLKS